LPRRILYLVHRVPYPPDKGDRIRAFHVLKHLARDASVSVACLADEPVADASIAELRTRCERVAIFPLSPWSRWPKALLSLLQGHTVSEGAFYSRALVATVGQWAKERAFDSVMLSASSLAPYLSLPGLREVPAVVDLVDADSQKWLDYAAASQWPRAWLYRLESRRLGWLEKRLSASAQALVVVSEQEVSFLQKRHGLEGVRVVRNGVDLDYFRPPAAPLPENGCAFVGALDYLPNVDAACWFCHEVWPTVHRQVPQATVRLIGRRPVAQVKRLAAIPGVEVMGQVPDVRPHLAQAAIAIAPLRIARGLQNKILEAMAMSKAIIASPQALSGFVSKLELPVLSAASPTEWIDAVLRLLHSAPLRRDLGAACRQYVEAHHCWDSCLTPFDELLGLDPRAYSPAIAKPPKENQMEACAPAK
jgi:sugar transferase (PEP-CTERM/EpsH1 system associated)